MGLLQRVSELFVKPAQAMEPAAELRHAPSINNPHDTLYDVATYDSFIADGRSASVSPRTAMALGAVHTCVKIIAEDVSTQDICIERRDGDRWVTDTSHYLNDLFQSPSAQYGLQTILEVIVGNAALSGNGLGLIRRHPRTGRVTDIDVRSHTEFSIYTTIDRSKVWYYTSDGTGNTLMLRPDEVIHLMAFTIDGLKGLSPVAIASSSIGMSMNALAYTNDGYANGGFGGGSIESDELMDASSRLKYSQQVRQAQRMGLLPVLDRGMKLVPNKISPRDIDFVNTMKWGQADIASIYRVPVEKLGGDTKAPGTSREQAAIAYVTDCIRPWVRRVETELERKLLSRSEQYNYRIKFDLDSLMRGDSTAQAHFYSQMLTNRVMVPNEVRAKYGLSPVEWGADPIDHQKSAKDTPGGPNIHTITKSDTDEEQ